MIWETRKTNESADEKLTEKFTRRESLAQRNARLKRKPIDTATAASLLQLFKVRSFYR